MTEIIFKSDKTQRDKYFTAAHFAHPAKLMLPLQLWLIENYSKPGDTILDCLAGSGTLLIACTLGRNVILVELESKFVQMQRDNWTKIQMLGAEMGYSMGTCQILQGDARQLPEVLADVVITSPPYAEAQTGGGISAAMRGEGNYNITTNLPRNCYQPSEHGNTQGNIGNLKGESYLSAMLLVYEGCYRVLKPQGIMCLVTKNFIRQKQEIRLDLDTILLCEAAGFTLIERHYRKLTQQSFWRTIYQQKYPDAPVLDKEDILIFKKG